MYIQFYDRGTPAGKMFFSKLEEACTRLQIDDRPEYITDMYKVINQGIQAKSVLMIDNQPVFIDKFPSQSELEAILTENRGQTAW